MLALQTAQRRQSAAQRHVTHSKADDAVAEIGRQMVGAVVRDDCRADRRTHNAPQSRLVTSYPARSSRNGNNAAASARAVVGTPFRRLVAGYSPRPRLLRGRS